MSGVQRRYWGTTLDGFLRTTPSVGSACDAVREWAAAPASGAGLFLSGPPGTGKTHLLTAAVRARLERGDRGIRFVNVALMLDRLRYSVGYSESKAAAEFAYLRDEASVVILDDLGKEKMTDWVSERLYVICEKRYGDQRATLASSNRTLNELAELGYGAIVSRLLENGPLVILDGKDQRPVMRFFEDAAAMQRPPERVQ